MSKWPKEFHGIWNFRVNGCTTATPYPTTTPTPTPHPHSTPNPNLNLHRTPSTYHNHYYNHHVFIFAYLRVWIIFILHRLITSQNQEIKQTGGLWNCKLHTVMAMAVCTLDETLVSDVVQAVLKSTLPTELFVGAINESLGEKENFLNDLVIAALQSVWSTEEMETAGPSELEMNKDIMRSAMQYDLHLSLIYYVVMFGINEISSSGKIDNFIMNVVKQLLVSGRLDDIILTGVRRFKNVSQEEDFLLDEISTAVHSRWLDNIVMDAFADMVNTGVLDEAVSSAIMEILQSGILDSIISNIMVQLGREVSWRSVFSKL